MTADFVTLSQADYACFGVRTARVEDISQRPVAEVLRFCQAQAVALLIARCPASQVTCVQQLQVQGFLLMDTLCDYARALADLTQPQLPSGFRVRQASLEDQEALANLFRRSFSPHFSSHYHSDPRLGPYQATEAYIAWVKNSLRSAEEFVLVMETEDGRVVGSSSYRCQGKDATLLFGATDPSFQNKGLYRLLFQFGLFQLATQGVCRIKTATQVSNVAAQRAFYACGLKPVSARYTFHKWFD
jgi:dTDP-4-amino-4,6-dideoxy-D-galactose acyltransferase